MSKAPKNRPRSNKKMRKLLLAEWRDAGARFAEKVERNPWAREYRAAALRAEAAGHDGPIRDFARRFKQAEALRYSIVSH
jgi:hypothetical protein